MRALRIPVLLILVILVAAPALAQSERPIQVSLLNPVQIFSEDESIKGLRLNILYGKNANMTGVDIGFIAGHTTGNGKGVQWNLVNITEGDFLGWQWGAANIVGGAFTGYQLGWYNSTKGPTEGFQWGIVNTAEDMSGFQLGLVNYAKKMYGLQIGLINIISSKDKLPVLPIVNWSF